MSEENNGFLDQIGRGLVGLFKFLIRLTFVLVLAVALGAGIFFGITTGLPALDRAYLQPVRDNTAAIAALQARATQSAEQHAAQVQALQDRVTELEVFIDGQKATVADLETRLAALAPLADSQAALETRLDDLDAALADVDEALAAAQEASAAAEALAEETAANADQLAALEALLAENPYPAELLYAELQAVKVMGLLSRAQVYLLQEETGLAQADLEAARDLLAAAAADGDLLGDTGLAVQARISLALGNLAARPDRALTDIQTAWDQLISALVPSPESPEEEAAPAPAPAAAPTPTATP